MTLLTGLTVEERAFRTALGSLLGQERRHPFSEEHILNSLISEIASGKRGNEGKGRSRDI